MKIHFTRNSVCMGDDCFDNSRAHFKYYSSPSKRGEYIENITDNSQYNMWHDGWIEEYKLCK